MPPPEPYHCTINPTLMFTGEQCGWLKDRYGISWQIVPTAMNTMLKDNDQKKIARVTKAFLTMKKFDVAQLRNAFDGR